MAMAVVSMIAAVAISSLGGMKDSGRDAVLHRQAEMVAFKFASAQAAGAKFAVQSREGVVDALTQPGGVKGGGIFSDMVFSLDLSPDERSQMRASKALVGRVLPDGRFQLEFQLPSRP